MTPGRLDTQIKHTSLWNNFEKEILLCPQDASAQQIWEYFRDTIHSKALSVFGEKHRKGDDWFGAFLDAMGPEIETNNTTHANQLWSPCQGTLFFLRAAILKVQQPARY